MPAPLAPHFLGPRAPSLGRQMLTDWDSTDKVSAVWPTRFDLICPSQWNGNTIYRSTRGLISKRTTRVGASVLEGLAQLNLIRPIRSCAPSSSHAYHRRCAKTHSPPAQKLPVLLSRDHEGVTESIKKPLECAASLASKKVCGCTYSFGESEHQV